jgi:hypothetical protein
MNIMLHLRPFMIFTVFLMKVLRKKFLSWFFKPPHQHVRTNAKQSVTNLFLNLNWRVASHPTSLSNWQFFNEWSFASSAEWPL